MPPPPACVALAAAAGVLGGAPFAGASRLALGQLDGAGAGEAHSFQPFRAWTAVAAAGNLLADRFAAAAALVGVQTATLALGNRAAPRVQAAKQSPPAAHFASLSCDVGRYDAGAAVRFEFCGRPAGFTPIYQREPDCNTASTNAGDFNLYVGGGAINKAFKEVLQLEADNGYARLHKLLLAEAEASPGALVGPRPGSEAEGLARDLGLLGCFARVPSPSRGAVAAVFVDVFSPKRRPLNPRNVAMLYVVGPKGSGAPGGNGPTVDGAKEFLLAVEDLGANAISALAEYNARADAGAGEHAPLPRIEAVQWCLVSGGVYRHPGTSKLDVAEATVRGMEKGSRAVAAGPSGAGVLPVVRFAYDDAAFEKAVDSLSARAP